MPERRMFNRKKGALLLDDQCTMVDMLIVVVSSCMQAANPLLSAMID
jgi:hypothetical protein